MFIWIPCSYIADSWTLLNLFFSPGASMHCNVAALPALALLTIIIGNYLWTELFVCAPTATADKPPNPWCLCFSNSSTAEEPYGLTCFSAIRPCDPYKFDDSCQVSKFMTQNIKDRRGHGHSFHKKKTLAGFLASQYVSQWVTQQIETLLMWPRWTWWQCWQRWQQWRQCQRLQPWKQWQWWQWCQWWHWWHWWQWWQWW